MELFRFHDEREKDELINNRMYEKALAAYACIFVALTNISIHQWYVIYDCTYTLLNMPSAV